MPLELELRAVPHFKGLINPYQAGLFGQRIGRGGRVPPPLIYRPFRARNGTQISQTWSQMKADIFLYIPTLTPIKYLKKKIKKVPSK